MGLVRGLMGWSVDHYFFIYKNYGRPLLLIVQYRPREVSDPCVQLYFHDPSAISDSQIHKFLNPYRYRLTTTNHQKISFSFHNSAAPPPWTTTARNVIPEFQSKQVGSSVVVIHHQPFLTNIYFLFYYLVANSFPCSNTQIRQYIIINVIQQYPTTL